MSEPEPTPEPFDPLAAARGRLEPGPPARAGRVDPTCAGPIDPLRALALGQSCDGLGNEGLGDPAARHPRSPAP